MRLVKFFLLLLIWGEPALAADFFPKPALLKIGAPQKNREESYHYGFNGKYKDNEWAGGGNHIDYGARGLDPRTGRFISVDPLSKKYPWYTPFQFAGNQPIGCIDLDGLEEYHAIDGSLIGKYGTSTEIRVVYSSEVENASALIGLNGCRNFIPGLDAINARIRDNGSAPIFSQPDDAAEAWGQKFNGASINSNTELNSFLFVTKINNERVISYSEPKGGGLADVTNTILIPDGTRLVADIHSHGAFMLDYDNNNFSTGSKSDVEGYQSMNSVGYLTTPNGSLKKYVPGQNPATLRDRPALRENLPSDPKDPDRKNKIDPPNPQTPQEN